MVTFSVDDNEFTVARHIKYKGDTLGYTGGDSLMIFQNGELLTDANGKALGQDIVEQILGMDEKLFLNTILFGQRMKKLISASNDDKAKVFETMFNLDWLPKAKEEAKRQLDEQNKLLSLKNSELSTQIVLRDSKISDLEAVKAEINEAKEGILDSIGGEDNTLGAIEETLTDSDTAKDSWAEEKLYLTQLITDSDKSAKDLALYKVELEVETKVVNEALLARDKGNEFLNRMRLDVAAQKSEFALTSEKYSTRSSQLASLRADLEDKQRGMNEYHEANDYTDAIEELEPKIEAIKDTPSVGLLDSKIKAYDKQLMEKRGELITSDRLLGEYQIELKGLDHANCPTCNQQLTPVQISELKDTSKVKIANISKAINKLREEIDIIEETYKYTEQTRVTAVLLERYNKDIDLMMDKQDQADAMIALYQKGIDSVTKAIAELENLPIVDIKGMASNLKTQEENLISTTLTQTTLIEAYKMAVESHSRILGKFNAESSLFNALQPKISAQRVKVSELEALMNVDTKTLLAQREQCWARKTKLIAQLDALPLKTVQREQEIVELTKVVDKLVKEAEVLTIKRDHLVWWNGSAFSSAGIKAQVFDAMLTNLNVIVDKYAGMVGMGIRFSVNLDTARKNFEVEVMYRGETVGYDELSGGEQQRVDVATIFACHELLSAKIDTNILILDEVFEGLDLDGIEIVFSMLRNIQKEGNSVHIITHRHDINSTYCKIKEISNINGALIIT